MYMNREECAGFWMKKKFGGNVRSKGRRAHRVVCGRCGRFGDAALSRKRGCWFS